MRCITRTPLLFQRLVSKTESLHAKPSTPMGSLPWLALCLCLAVAYALAGAYSVALGRGMGHGVPLWPAMGIALAALVRGGLNLWPGVALGALVAAWAQSGQAPLAFWVAAGNTLGPLATAWWLLQHRFNTSLTRRRDLALLLGAGVGGGAVITAFTASCAYVWTGTVPASEWAHFGLALWGSDALGLMLLAVPAFTLRRQALARIQWLPSLGIAAAALVCAALAFMGPLSLSSGGQGALAYLPHVLLAWLVMRAGIGVASATVAVISLGAAYATSAGVGFFSSVDLAQAFALLWGYIATLIGITLLLHSSNSDLVTLEARGQMAMDGAGLGVADWDVVQRDGFNSQTWLNLVGERCATPLQWSALVHPEERPTLEHALEQVQAGELPRFTQELRTRHGDAWRWVEVQVVAVGQNAKGGALRILATVQEITGRRDAQERERLSASLFQHLHEGLLITDAELRALDVNPAYSHILGVPRNEVLGNVPALLRPTPSDPMARQQRAAMWTSLQATGAWRGECVERRRSGELCTLQTTISTVKGPDQQVRYHVLVISDITESRLQRDRLERQAHFDELTRLPNRARLQELLGAAMRSADSDGYLLTVCYLDLDRFKPVNDRFGHAAGDRLLVELAGRLRSALRSNEMWADAAGRLGGDEFVLLLRAGTMEEARLAVERVLRVVSQPYVLESGAEPLQVTASLGATIYPVDRSDADTLLRHADHAMYGAKQAGRNGYQFFDPEHRRRTEERVMAIGRVQEALDQNEFVLFYQPKVDMRRNVVVGFEALLRWEHPQHGLIAPMQFLPLIENTGLSARVGDWVLGQALEHLAAWRREGLEFSVSVNVSARHFQEPDFALRLSELLARHPEPLATALELEVLETAAQADIEATSALLERCQALGVRFALDDFGTGYSTLTYLKRLPVNVLKIDRSFVHHMLEDPQDRAIVEGVIGLARTFQCVAVAEGVESPAQARTLLEMGCDIGQGTGIAAPMPAKAVGDWVRAFRGLFALGQAGGTGAAVLHMAGSANE